MIAERKTPAGEERTISEVERELRKRTAERDEAVAREAAVIQVLQTINSSPGEVAPVFDTILERATQLCEAVFGNLYTFNGSTFMPVAVHGASDFGAWFTGRGAIVPPPGVPLDRISKGEDIAHIVDATDTEAYLTHSRHREVIDRAGIRTWIGVALRSQNGLLGAIIVYRQEVRPFTENQVALLQSFAVQAVLAIENARLLNELQQSLQQQTATADVLKVISRSAFDLQTVLETLIKSAVELSGANRGSIFLREGDVFPLKAASHTTPEFVQYWAANPPRAGRGSATHRVIASGKVEVIPDVLQDPEMQMPPAALARIRAALGVPMLRDNKVEGVLVLTRAEPGHFSKSQIGLVQTFADQAVIAVENVRLFDETQARSKELAASLDELRTAQDRLVQTEKLASLGQLTAGIAHEIKNPLNFVNNFSALSAELIDELDETLARAPLDKKMRGDVDELTEMLKSNFEKVVQHGKRADSIVKNMLQHSREGSGERRSADINALVRESLNLAFHGARAEKPGFEVTLKHDLASDAGTLELYPQEITRALLNLISNGFYAATRRKAENGDGTFEPTLSAATRNLGETVEIRIRDNGPGISHEVREKMFNPFFTTKPTGEGTGLGLSMTHDIIVKQHGGRIDVETEPGLFTEFIITLPRGNATTAGLKTE